MFPIADEFALNGAIQDLKSLDGFNVTVPWKEKVIPFLDELSEAAREVGAVNCVKVSGNGGKVKLKGFNTILF